MSTITFYRNFKDGKVFISGKNEKGVWFSFWKSTEFNNDLYLENDKFKKGLEIDKSLLRLHDDKPGCRVLVFKDAEEEAKYCITKEEVEKRKSQRKVKGQSQSNFFDYIDDILKELFFNNENLVAGELIKKALAEKNAEPDLTETDDENLPF